MSQAQPLGPLQVETLHRVSLAQLIVYAGLKPDLRRIHGMTAAGLRLGCGGRGRGVALQRPLPDLSFEQQALGRVMHPLPWGHASVLTPSN